MTRATPIAAMAEQMFAAGIEQKTVLDAIESAELQSRRRPKQAVATSNACQLTILPQANLRGTRLPVDWCLPYHGLEYALDHGMEPERVAIESEKFKNYWLAKTGAGATKRDWDATWRNW